MKQIEDSSIQDIIKNKIKPIWFLVTGIVILSATHLTFGIGLFAWIASVPFLLYLSATKGIKSRLLFAGALITAWSFATAKIISPPMPYAMVFLFSIPLGLIQLPGYLLWAKFRNHKFSFLLFPTVMVLMEWMQYSFTPFASWGIAAYTQMDNLILMQSVSIFGVAGLGFLIYWINITIAEAIVKNQFTFRIIRVPLMVFASIIIFGSVRYNFNKSAGQETIKVAAVGTDSKVGGLPLPSQEITKKDMATLFARTRAAANANAKLIVWNEGSIGIMPKDEKVWKDSLSSLASELKINLVAAYVMPVSENPFKYINKYLFFLPNGSIAFDYLKHQPVPGEPAVKGVEPLQIINFDKVKIGAAICYDYDFPYLAKGFGNLNSDIVALPSSDWRGIDPIHTKMAAFRAIEQGHSVLRSTRFGLSAAITPYGEMIAQQSSFDNNDKIMIADLPARGITTVYSIIGDSFILVCFGLIIFFLFVVLRSGNLNPSE